jgi:hypothetical protein
MEFVPGNRAPEAPSVSLPSAAVQKPRTPPRTPPMSQRSARSQALARFAQQAKPNTQIFLNDAPVNTPYHRGTFSLVTPSFLGEESAYRKLLREIKRAEPIPEVYVPPWRRTMIDIYGEEHAKAMRKQPETYEKRATRFAEEERQRRLPQSRRAQMQDLNSNKGWQA